MSKNAAEMVTDTFPDHSRSWFHCHQIFPRSGIESASYLPHHTKSLGYLEKAGHQENRNNSHSVYGRRHGRMNLLFWLVGLLARHTSDGRTGRSPLTKMMGRPDHLRLELIHICSSLLLLTSTTYGKASLTPLICANSIIIN